MIYLASPYTDNNLEIMQVRYEMVCEACKYLFQQGIVVYSPIAHWHPIAIQYSLQQAFSFWRRQNFGMIDCCDQFCILTLRGWGTSTGIKKETKYAEKKKKLIKHISLLECIS